MTKSGKSRADLRSIGSRATTARVRAGVRQGAARKRPLSLLDIKDERGAKADRDAAKAAWALRILPLIAAFNPDEVKQLNSTVLDALKERVLSCDALSASDRVLVIGLLGYVASNNSRRPGPKGLMIRLKPEKNVEITPLGLAFFVQLKLLAERGKIDPSITDVTGYENGSKKWCAVRRQLMTIRARWRRDDLEDIYKLLTD